MPSIDHFDIGVALALLGVLSTIIATIGGLVLNTRQKAIRDALDGLSALNAAQAAEIKSLREQVEEIPELRQQLSAWQAKYAALQSELSDWKAKYGQLAAELEQLRKSARSGSRRERMPA